MSDASDQGIFAAKPSAFPFHSSLLQRFARHRLAVGSLYLLVVLYGVAVFAEFLAPYPPGLGNVERIYCPPQVPIFDSTHGLHTPVLQRTVDPVTLRNDYILTDSVTPLGFFVKGTPYKLWGLIPMDRHFIGVKGESAKFAAETADDPFTRSSHTFYLLGGDEFGRDVLSRILYGARISLSIGLVAVAASFLLGALIGGISGYVGGSVDTFIQRGIEVVNSFPQLPLWLAIAALLPAGWSPLQTYFAITLALSLLGWTNLARVVRGRLLSMREEEYTTAARVIGSGQARIIFRHLLPGLTSHIVVSLSLSIPAMILGETALSFLGLGLRAPVVSWGVMLQDCLNFEVVTSYPWLLMPVVLVVLTVLTFNFLGDGLRDAADPYSGS